nr:MAG TPA: hypothetical protein [Caudoviricetes sp.]
MTSSLDLMASRILLREYGRFPGEYFRLPAGDRAALCAMLLYEKLYEED